MFIPVDFIRKPNARKRNFWFSNRIFSFSISLWLYTKSFMSGQMYFNWLSLILKQP